MDQPPPYQGYGPQQGFSNPGHIDHQGYPPQGYAEPTQGYYPPIISSQTSFPQQQTNQGYPQQQGIDNTGYSAQKGYSQQQGFTNPSYSQQAGYNSNSQIGHYIQKDNQNSSSNQSQPKSNDTVGELSGFGEKSIRRGFIRKVVFKSFPK